MVSLESSPTLKLHAKTRRLPPRVEKLVHKVTPTPIETLPHTVEIPKDELKPTPEKVEMSIDVSRPKKEMLPADPDLFKKTFRETPRAERADTRRARPRVEREAQPSANIEHSHTASSGGGIEKVVRGTLEGVGNAALLGGALIGVGTIALVGMPAFLINSAFAFGQGFMAASTFIFGSIGHFLGGAVILGGMAYAAMMLAAESVKNAWNGVKKFIGLGSNKNHDHKAGGHAHH